MDNELTRYHKITFNSDGFITDPHETTIYIANSKLLLLHVFSVARGSSTAACLTLCMSTFIGSMFRRITMMVHNCLHAKAPRYLTDYCTPVSASRRHLRSASRRHLLVPRHNLSTYGRRAFSVAGPAAWNSLCDELRVPSLAADTAGQFQTVT